MHGRLTRGRTAWRWGKTPAARLISALLRRCRLFPTLHEQLTVFIGNLLSLGAVDLLDGSTSNDHIAAIAAQVVRFGSARRHRALAFDAPRVRAQAPGLRPGARNARQQTEHEKRREDVCRGVVGHEVDGLTSFHFAGQARTSCALRSGSEDRKNGGGLEPATVRRHNVTLSRPAATETDSLSFWRSCGRRTAILRHVRARKDGWHAVCCSGTACTRRRPAPCAPSPQRLSWEPCLLQRAGTDPQRPASCARYPLLGRVPESRMDLRLLVLAPGSRLDV
jgi:hypothetical protein